MLTSLSNNYLNTEDLKNSEIIIRESILNKVLKMFIFSAFAVLIFYKFENNLFKWEKFNPNGIITIVFLLLILLSIFSWLKIFVNNPIMKLNEKGVWINRFFFPFYSLKLTDWNKIEFVELNIIRYSKYRKGLALIISKKGSLNTEIIYLDDIDHPKEEIISLFRKHSKFLNYVDRAEIKNYCRL